MALIINPSERWEGNDGSWSTFAVNIGTPYQQMRVLPATSESAIFVVLAQGCPNKTTFADCQAARGAIFDPDQNDISWSPQYSSDHQPYFQVPFVSEAGLTAYNDTNAEVGLDAVTLAWTADGASIGSVPLHDQVVGGFAAPVPWLGLLGLSGRPSSLQNVSSSQNSTLGSLVANSSIYGPYWAYTAGAAYRSPKALGSLTFGGYDAARVNMATALTVPFDQDSDHDLLVAVNSITISSDATTPVQGLPIVSVIDSVVPEIWLPQEACSSFEAAFGLVWNNTYEMYLVNDTQHANLIAMNPSVTFNLAVSVGNQHEIRITLPYAAFDLTAKYPLAGISDFQTTQRYFPLKRATDPSQYFLGRTFLQEAYITADYSPDALNFTVAPTQFPPNTATMNITTVYPGPRHHSSSTLSAGAIAGIAIGAVAILAILAGLGFWFWRKKHRKAKGWQNRSTGIFSTRTASMDNTTIVGDPDPADRDRFEFYNTKPFSSPPVDHHNEGDDYFKAELDARATAVSPSGHQRYELYAGSVRRPYHNRNMSDSSQGSGVSPVGAGRYSNMMGEPSPLFDQPSPPTHYPSGSPTPPHTRHASATGAGEIYEMAERGG